MAQPAQPGKVKADMKVELVVTTAAGSKFWRYEMEYFELPPAYVVEVGSACQAYAAYINGLKGNVGSAEEAGYNATFTYETSVPIAAPHEKTGKGEGKAERLAFSQVVQLQSDGIVMQERLLNGARLEVKTGQRS
jgi:hypothetical protein